MTQIDFEEARQYMTRAYMEIDAGKFNLENFPDTTVEKAYYGLFNACHAALAVLGVYPSSHEGVHNMISKEYVKDRKLPKELPSTLSNLLGWREKATYKFAFFNSHDALILLNRATEAVNQIYEHLHELYPDVINPDTLKRTYRKPDG